MGEMVTGTVAVVETWNLAHCGGSQNNSLKQMHLPSFENTVHKII